MTKMLSTSAFAKQLKVPAKELFTKFQSLGLLERDQNNAWALTSTGSSHGGEYKESKQYGRYIVWPESIELPEDVVNVIHHRSSLISATAIGKHFEISAKKSNYILSELGWLTKSLKGWTATEPGMKQGAIQDEDPKTGIPFVRWPEQILQSKSLTNTIAEFKGTATIEHSSNETPEHNHAVSFREKFPAKHRSTDGHMVRSKAEMLVDNWLYMAEIVHAYERKLPIEEEVYCDFYIPTGKVYIEYWGYENDSKYIDRKHTKQEIYKKYGFNLIELQDADVQNLDDILPRLLLKYGVQAY